MPIQSPTKQAEQILSLEEGQEILAPYLDRLNRCIEHGWNMWKTDYVHKHHILGARARAAIVFDEIVNCAMMEFQPGPELIPKRTPSTFMLYIGNSLTLRFKKLRRGGRSSNIPTDQQKLFYAQAQLRLPTMAIGTIVQAGYELDSLQQEIIRKSIVCQKNNSILWRVPLSLNAAGLVELPPSDNGPATPQNTPRFEAKHELTKEVPAPDAVGEKG